MTEPDREAPPPAPEIVPQRKRPRFTKVWIIPAVAALVALSLFFQRLAREGPEVTISFKSVQGIEAGKTPIRYKDVAIGVVESVRFSPDYGMVDVTARMTREAAPLMTDGAAFWIVRPRVSLGEISGLGTLFSGNYIAFERGAADRPQRVFTGLDDARVVGPDTPGRRFVLRSHEALRIDAGLPIYYLGLEVGQVIAAAADKSGRGVEIQVFVNAPYDRYVRASTRFWNADGIDLKVQGGDVSVRTESLMALLAGGIAFDNPPSAAAHDEPPADADSSFPLHRDRAAAFRAPADGPRYVLLFDEPVDGLQPGSPVRFLGVRAGEVTKLGLAYDRGTGRVRARLEVALSLRDVVDGEGGPEVSFLRDLVMRRGLRAQLRTASLLTGQRYVALDYFPKARPVRLDWEREPPALPVVTSALPAFEDKLDALMSRLGSLPLGEAVGDARALMQQARLAFASVEGLARDVDRQALPGFVATMDEARGALASAQRMLDGASATLVDGDAPAQRELRAALQEMTRAARAFGTLSDSLERHPESLLWGRKAQAALP
jgi:paraquat-inducible protein B